MRVTDDDLAKIACAGDGQGTQAMMAKELLAARAVIVRFRLFNGHDGKELKCPTCVLIRAYDEAGK